MNPQKNKKRLVILIAALVVVVGVSCMFIFIFPLQGQMTSENIEIENEEHFDLTPFANRPELTQEEKEAVLLEQKGEAVRISINSFDKINDSTVTITETDGETHVSVEIKLIDNEMLSEQQQQQQSIREFIANGTDAAEDNVTITMI